MNKSSTGFNTTKKSQVMSFRLPYSAYEAYERRCIELQIEMSALLKQAVEKFLQEKKGQS